MLHTCPPFSLFGGGLCGGAYFHGVLCGMDAVRASDAGVWREAGGSGKGLDR